MRKPGNLDEQGRPVYTLDERRSLTADIYENRVVKQTVERVQRRLDELAADGDQQVRGEAQALARVLEGALRQAPFLDEVGFVGGRTCPRRPHADPAVPADDGVRAELAG
jgi:hypothetical protein